MITENAQSIEDIMRTTLKSLGYFRIELDSENQNQYYVLADGNSRKIIVQVKDSKSSTYPPKPTVEEIKILKAKAKDSDREPWAALMKIDSNSGELIDNILWFNLSK